MDGECYSIDKYCTAYHSKNTQKEDNEKAGKAAKRMNGKILEGQIITEENLGSIVMIGAIILSTDAHICVAPMAA